MFKNGLIVSFTKHANHITFTFVWCKNLKKAACLAWKPNIISKARDKRSCLKPDDLFSSYFAWKFWKLTPLSVISWSVHPHPPPPPLPALSLSLPFLSQLQWLPPLSYRLTKECPTFMSPTKTFPSLSD